MGSILTPSVTDALGLPRYQSPWEMADPYLSLREQDPVKYPYNWHEDSRGVMLDSRVFWIVMACLYVPMTFGGISWMRQREAWQLKRPLLIWNIIASVLSGIGFIVCLLALLDDLSRMTLIEQLCDNTFYARNQYASIVLTLFCQSKVCFYIIYAMH